MEPCLCPGAVITRLFGQVSYSRTVSTVGGRRRGGPEAEAYTKIFYTNSKLILGQRTFFHIYQVDRAIAKLYINFSQHLQLATFLQLCAFGEHRVLALGRECLLRACAPPAAPVFFFRGASVLVDSGPGGPPPGLATAAAGVTPSRPHAAPDVLDPPATASCDSELSNPDLTLKISNAYKKSCQIETKSARSEERARARR